MTCRAEWTAASGRTHCEVSFANGGFPVDIDAAAGGGEHPSPHDILDAASAACTALTLELYAKRKSIALERVSVEVTHETVAGRYAMTRRVRAEGSLSDAERASLHRIAEACPIHKTLLGEITIDTTVVVSP
jgi:putative redox protein